MKKFNKFLFTSTLVCSLLTSQTAAISTDISRDVWQTSQLLSIASTSMNQNITRGEFARMLVATSIYKDDIIPFGFTIFVDVEPSHPNVSEIKICLENSWMVGYLDGHFRPEQTVTYEEASVSILKLLGYETMSGQYPYAFTDKFESLFLNDDLDARIGDPLTHKDCMQLFYNTLNTKTATGTIYATHLGLPVDSDNEIDPTQWAKEDQKGPFTLQKEDAFPFFTNEETLVFRDDRTSSLNQLESYDIAYYHVKMNTVFAYSEKITGKLSSILNSYNPSGITLAGVQYTLETDKVKDKFAFDGIFDDFVGEEDEITLLLGQDREVADAFFATEVMADDHTQGPYTLHETENLPFPVDENTIYKRNDLPSTRSSLSVYDICYYNKKDNTLWSYNEKITGTLNSIVNTHNPSGIVVDGVQYSLETKEMKDKFSFDSIFEADDKITLLLGEDGAVADAFFAEEIMADDYTQGPYTMGSSGTLPFAVNEDTIYIKNDVSSSKNSLSRYDICYFNAEDNTVWAYDHKITGRLTNIGNPHDPVSVTVAGNTYSLETKEVKEKFEAGGAFEKEGVLVTLLMGQYGDVADVVSVAQMDATIVGIVLNEELVDVPTGPNTSYVSRAITVMGTDGKVHKFDTTNTYEPGRVISVTYENGQQMIRGISDKTLSGKVNASGTAIGTMKFAENIEIFEISNTNYGKIFPERLAGLSLEKSDVRYYTTNDKGEIDSLLLEDATGDLAKFALVTKSTEVSSGMMLSGQYTYLEKGNLAVEVVQNRKFGISKGGVIFTDDDGDLDKIINLPKSTITWLGAIEASLENGKLLSLADEVQVYELYKDDYSKTTLNALSDISKYKITAYYDEGLFTAGNQIRIILAERLDSM